MSEALNFFEHGFLLHQQGKLDQAKIKYQIALNINPLNFDALHLLGVVEAQLFNYQTALILLKKALAIQSEDEACHNNLGNIYSSLNRHDDALRHYNIALNLSPDYAEAWSNKSKILHSLKLHAESIKCINRALELQPSNVEWLVRKGNILHDLKLFHDSIYQYDKALILQADYAEALSDKGNAFFELGLFEEANICFDKAISHNSNLLQPYINKGSTLLKLNKIKDAIFFFNKAYSIDKDANLLLGDIENSRMRISDWHMFDERADNLLQRVLSKKLSISPFQCISLIEDPLVQISTATNFSFFKYPPSSPAVSTLKDLNQKKIRIGYFSPDFKDHPVAALIVELFELHHRDQFEIIAFSFCGYSDSVLGLRIQKAFDQFIDVSGMSDFEVAMLSADLGINIAVDLCGHTAQSRTGIFAHRAAPIQVNFLGYPGTMGAPYFDYIIADKTLIPEEAFNFYSEKIVYLPHTYQPNDRNRIISNKHCTKQELGLPESGFIFCCFNNNYKILPDIFNSWMRILLSVEDSVLWLFEDNPWAADNLKIEAINRGVEPDRLVFAKKIPREEHLARYLYADLFLDTYPYNAHTTASDALWAGLPVLTLMGNSFASRVAASLLKAIDLPELITSNQYDYEALAIELATAPQKLNILKQKLQAHRLTSPLFDTTLFTENIEKAFIQMHKRYQSKLHPDHLLGEN